MTSTLVLFDNTLVPGTFAFIPLALHPATSRHLPVYTPVSPCIFSVYTHVTRYFSLYTRCHFRVLSSVYTRYHSGTFRFIPDVTRDLSSLSFPTSYILVVGFSWRCSPSWFQVLPVQPEQGAASSAESWIALIFELEENQARNFKNIPVMWEW